MRPEGEYLNLKQLREYFCSYTIGGQHQKTKILTLFIHPGYF